MTSSQMMLFGGGPPPATFVGRATSQFTGAQSIFGMSVAGNSSLTSMFTLSYNGGSSAALPACFSSSGGYIFQRQLTTTPSSTSVFMGYRGVAVDSSGNSYSTFGLRNSAGTIDTGYLVKYNSSGTIQWQRQLTATSNTVQAIAVGIESGGANVYVGVSFYVSGNQAFGIAKYSSAGVLQWQRQLTGGSTNAIEDLHVDSSNNVYICGQTNRGTASFDGFLAKYNSSGTIQWQRQFTYGASQGNITSVTTDSSLNVYCVTGNPTTMTWKLTSAGATTFQITNTGNYMAYRGLTCDSTNVYGATYTGTNTNVYSAFSTSGSSFAWFNGITTSATHVSGGSSLGETGYLYHIERAVTGSDVYGAVYRIPINGANVSSSVISASPISVTYNTVTNTGTLTSTAFSNNAGAHTDGAGTMTSATGTLTDAGAANGNNTVTF